MGRVLSVRLSAATYDEEDVFRSWPGLCALAWPGKGDIVSGSWKPKPGAFPAPIAAESVRHGVLDLVHALGEEYEFGDWEHGLKDDLKNGMADLRTAAAKLDAALENWKPQDANAATNAIEDALDKLERTLA